MIRALSVAAFVIVVAAAYALGGHHSSPRSAHACTGGISNLEWFSTRAERILIGEVIDAGDDIIRAPTLAPAATVTPTITLTPQWWTKPTSAPPTPSPTSTAVPPPFRLAGINVTFRVEQTIAGEPVTVYETGKESRAYIEREIRRLDAGMPNFGSCGVGAFTPVYALGARYLLFTEKNGASEYVPAAFRLRDDEVVFDDRGLMGANNGFLYMEPSTYAMFFAGVKVNPEQPRYISADSVQLSAVLRAVAYLRGGIAIYLPDTGSAGLKSPH